MFCSKCGTSLQPDADFCTKCGQATAGATGTALSTAEQRTPLWTPNAASLWSIFFTPALGAYLHALNWRALREPAKEKSAMQWFYASLAMPLAYLAIIAFSRDPEKGETLVSGLSLFYLLAWYFAAAREQAAHVKHKLGTSYPRRPWAKPLLVSLGAVFGYALAAFIMAFISILATS